MNYIIDGYFGFGDNIWHIPFVHHLAKTGEVYMTTPFPELFQFPQERFDVYCKKPTTNLKLQLQNMTNNGLYSKSAGHKPNGQRLRFDYGSGLKKGLSVIQSFESLVPLEGDFHFSFAPDRRSSVDEIMRRVRDSGKKLCVVRLPSVRAEWANANRNCKMEYMQLCINHLKREYYFLSIGDIGNQEEYDGTEPEGIDEKRDRHHVNHLGIWEVMDLINRSDMVLSIPCNVIPICQLLKKKAFIIYGGYVPHSPFEDPRLFPLGFVEPEPFCFCITHEKNGHRCKKEIPEEKILSTLEKYIAGEPWN